MALAPENLAIMEMNISETVEKEIISENHLPANWRDYPAPEQLAEIGTDWLKSQSSLLLDVPSAVVSREMNTLINPLHKDIEKIRLVSVEKFSFDSRLLRGD